MPKAIPTTLSHHYQAALALSPDAARMAARLLERSMNIPFEWRLSLRTVLAERGRFRTPHPPRQTASEHPRELRPRMQEAAMDLRSADIHSQRQAQRFIQDVQGASDADSEAGRPG